MGTGNMRLNRAIPCPAADEGHTNVNPFVVEAKPKEGIVKVECPVCETKWDVEMQKYADPGD